MKAPNIIIGTSGHIDHGKSAIVKALTNTDPDRLKEEKVRGMTIDLGYAFYDDKTAFIDVPGHERFVKNMVAGTTTIDFVLFVIAADDGIMPQTTEHLDILTLLGVERGIIVLNKIDLVDQEWTTLVEDELRSLTKDTFLEDAPLIRFSAKTMAGLEELRTEIDKMIQNPPERFDRGYFWMPIDRSFTIQGFGTVITGSVLSGELKKGDEVEILPKGKKEKVRGLQRHGQSSDRISIGDRGAINLQSISRSEIARGDVVCTPGYGLSTRRLDVNLLLLSSSARALKDQTRIRLHVGTSEILARVRLLDCIELAPGQSCFAQLMLEKTLSVNRRERFVIRSYSPSITIGGGIVLNNQPFWRYKRFDTQAIAHLKRMQADSIEDVTLEYLKQSRKPKSLDELVRAIGISEGRLLETLSQLSDRGEAIQLVSGVRKLFLTADEFNRLEGEIITILEQFHKDHPHLPGIGRAEVMSRLDQGDIVAPFIELIIKRLTREGKIRSAAEMLALSSFQARLQGSDRVLYGEIIKLIDESGFSAPTIKELCDRLNRERSEIDLALQYGKAKEELIILKNGLVYRGDTLFEIRNLVGKFILKNGSITAAQLRDIIHASRKYAIEILEYFDQIGFTTREGDKRVLNEQQSL